VGCGALLAPARLTTADRLPTVRVSLSDQNWSRLVGAYISSNDRLKVGHITPSSNTVLEPLTCLMSRSYDDRVSHHFTRLKVEAITLRPAHTGQFFPEPMLAAAELLADAGVDAIVWNGTSGGWNGVDADRELCALISERTGIASTTTTLAQFEVLDEVGLHRPALALPYTQDVVQRITEEFKRAGHDVVASSSGGVSDNRSMAYVSEETVRGLVREADRATADSILIYCTGVAGAQLADELERVYGKPVFDSVAVTLWKALKMIGIEPRIDRWGRLLSGTLAPSSSALVTIPSTPGWQSTATG
jgi:maleate isomerase